MAQVGKAINSLLPLAADVTHPVAFMQVSDTAPPYLSALQREVLNLLQVSLLPHQQAEPVERYAFYDRGRRGCAIVVTGERQPFGNFSVRTGGSDETRRP